MPELFHMTGGRKTASWAAPGLLKPGGRVRHTVLHACPYATRVFYYGLPVSGAGDFYLIGLTLRNRDS